MAATAWGSSIKACTPAPISLACPSPHSLALPPFYQGLLLAWDFSRAETSTESLNSFQACLAYDPAAAMCHWGVAYAVGPFLNVRPPATGLLPWRLQGGASRQRVVKGRRGGCPGSVEV